MPDAPPVDDRLDGTIRACGSLIEWTVGALQHPGAAGEAEPIGLLYDRCSQPDSGLDAYATCRSLQAALASPQPDTTEPQGTIDEPPASQPPASQPPAPSPTPAARPLNQAIPVPGPDGRVKLPRKLRAEVPGATRIRYFDVSGRSASAPREADAATCRAPLWRAQCPRLRGPHLARGDDPRTEEGACTVVDATSAVSSVVHLPRWTKPKRVDAELLTWWRKVLADSARHEARHIRILQIGAGPATQAPRGPTLRLGRPSHRPSQKRANQSQTVFDRRESAKPLPPAP